MKSYYKESIYNIKIVLDDNTILLYNSHSGALSSVDESTNMFLLNLQTKTQEEVEVFEYFNILLESGYIIDSGFNESNFLLLENLNQQYSSVTNSISFVITPTLNCNMKCVYCFQNSISQKLRMKSSTVESSIVFMTNIIESNNNLNKFHIEWFGGEPLLEKEIIMNFSNRIKSVCAKNSVKYTSGIVSNGLLIDSETTEMFDMCSIDSIQISLDGGKAETCEIKRISENSFDRIIDNIISVSENYRTNLRFNIDKTNFQSVKKFTRELLGQQLDSKLKVYIAPVRGEGDNVLSSSEFSENLIEYYNFLLTEGFGKHIGHILPKVRYTSCGLIQKNNFVIDSQGELYKCEHLVGKKEFSVGNIFNGRNYSDAELMFVDNSYLGKCTKCCVFPICRGGCAVFRESDFTGSFCDNKVREIRELIKVEYKAKKLSDA